MDEKKNLTKIGKKHNDTLRLNNLIRKLGMEQVSVDNDGNPITRFNQLANLIWERALGYKEADIKKNVEIKHNPDKAFIRMIYDRMEGRIPTVQPDKDTKKVELADKISNQTKSRINALIENDD